MRISVRSISSAVCVLALAALAILAWVKLGFTLLTALLVLIAIGCPVAIFYAWWMSRRALRNINEARREP